MRPRDRDGEVCPFCIGHQPADCMCQGGTMLWGSERSAHTTKIAGHSLIVRCMMTIGDHDTDVNVAEAAFNRKGDLIAKHGQPDREWIDREWAFQLPDYEDRKRQRQKFWALDAEAATDPLSRYSLPPSYALAMMESAAEALGYKVEFDRAMGARGGR